MIKRHYKPKSYRRLEILPDGKQRKSRYNLGASASLDRGLIGTGHHLHGSAADRVQAEESQGQATPSVGDHVSLSATDVNNQCGAQETPTYLQTKTKLVEQWTRIQPLLLKLSRERESFSPEQGCSLCATTPATVRCTDCGPGAFYCEECCTKLHGFILYHKPQIIQGHHFTPFGVPVASLPGHTCSSSYTRSVTVYDIQGRQHELSVRCCGCEPELCTLWRLKLWPASPTQPSVFIHEDLLRRFYFYQMEGHVSLLSNCQASAFAANISSSFGGLLYKLLSKECWIQYQYFHHVSASMQDIITFDYNTNVCPACPLVEDAVNEVTINSADANFGLVRRKAAGHTVTEPRTEGIFFLPQDRIDQLLCCQGNASKSSMDNDCNEFQAGSALRAKIKCLKLDETGVFGSACRHEFPLVYFNIKSGGEKLLYSIAVIESVIEKLGTTAPIIFMYDVACLLHSHLKVNV